MQLSAFPFSTILFDLDGTLVDSAPDVLGADVYKRQVDGRAWLLCPCAAASRHIRFGQLHERGYGHYPASRSMEDPRRARP